MASFIDLHQGQKLILVNVEAVQSVVPHQGWAAKCTPW
jgi:hypothetical protein